MKNSTNDSDSTGFYFPKELVDRTIESLKAKEERRKHADIQENFVQSVEKVVSHYVTSLSHKLNGNHEK